MRPFETVADMPNYGTSAPPLIFIKFRGPKALRDRPEKQVCAASQPPRNELTTFVFNNIPG